MHKRNFFVILAASILLLASCAKEGPTGPTGPAGPVFYGTISGHVSLYDKYGSEVLTGLNVVNVTLSTSSIPATLDASGGYKFVNVGTGTYTITANADSDYAGTVLNNVNFISGNLYKDVKLSAIPDSFIISFAASLNSGSLSDSLALTVMPDTRVRKCIVFVGLSNVSSNPSLYKLKYVVNIPGTTGAVPYTIPYMIPRQDLLDAALASGTAVYYAAYSYVVNDVSVYEDITTGNNVYNAVNVHPIVDSAIVP